jgi:sugar phosphate isomerase/epimerase
MSTFEIGFCWGFDDVAPLEGLQRLKLLGFDGIELWPDVLDRHGVNVWADALAATGMRCLQLCPYFNFVNGPEAVAKSREDLLQFIDIGEHLQCKKLRVFTGPVHGAGVVGAAAATEDQWAAVSAGLQEFCDISASNQFELCLECHPGMLTETSQSAQRLLRDVNRPNLTVNIQIPLADEPWDYSFHNLGPFATHLHIHNWHSPVMDFGDGLTYLAEGWFDWESPLRYLVETLNRRLCVSIEHPKHGGKHDPWLTAEKDGKYLVGLRRRLDAATT